MEEDPILPKIDKIFQNMICKILQHILYLELIGTYQNEPVRFTSFY